MSPPLPVQAPRKAALAFIFIVVLIDVLAFGLIIPVLPHLIQQFSGGDTANAAYWVAVFGVSFAAIQFMSSPVHGALSDRFGRRPVILLSCLGLGLDFVLMALAGSLPLLLIGRMVAGLASASFSTANAYIADVVPADKRAASYGMIGAAFGIGFIVGPMLGGWLGGIHLRLPFWFAAGLALLNFCYGLFVLPESLPPERRTPRVRWAQANPFGALMLLRRYPQVLGLAAVVFIANLAHYVYPSVFVLFADYRYGWGPNDVGLVLALVGACSVVVNVWLVRLSVRWLGERRTMLFGLSCGVIGFLVYGVSPVGWMFLIGIPASSLWAVAAPATQALITRQVDPGAQGRVQGALMSLTSLAGIFAPALFAGSFGWAISRSGTVYLSGLPWFLAACLLAVGVLIAWRYARPVPASM